MVWSHWGRGAVCPPAGCLSRFVTPSPKRSFPQIAPTSPREKSKTLRCSMTFFAFCTHVLLASPLKSCVLGLFSPSWRWPQQFLCAALITPPMLPLQGFTVIVPSANMFFPKCLCDLLFNHPYDFTSILPCLGGFSCTLYIKLPQNTLSLSPTLFFPATFIKEWVKYNVMNFAYLLCLSFLSLH